MAGPGTIERPVEEGLASELCERWVVVVYDNDRNTFEEVTVILMIATGCSFDEASMETWEVHHLGKSVVHCADREECERVASVIRKIGIRTEVYEE